MATTQIKATWLLRAGLSFVFAYAGVTMLLSPEGYVAYLPELLDDRALTIALLRAFGLFELVLVAGFLSRRHVGTAALTALATLISIVAVNPDSFDVLFRNVAIATAAAALWVDERNSRLPAPTFRPAGSSGNHSVLQARTALEEPQVALAGRRKGADSGTGSMALPFPPEG